MLSFLVVQVDKVDAGVIPRVAHRGRTAAPEALRLRPVEWVVGVLHLVVERQRRALRQSQRTRRHAHARRRREGRVVGVCVVALVFAAVEFELLRGL